MTAYDRFQQSQLALAAYAVDLSPLMSNGPYVAALTAAGMASAEATTFASRWEVVDQFTDSSSGVSATIFQINDGTQRYLAIRGTEPQAADILADGILALGFAAKLNPQFNALKTKMDEWLADPAMLKDQTFTVSGHSLGGYLAAAVKQQYATKVTEAYMFNAPGSGGLVGNIVDLLSGMFDQSTPGANGIWNIKASEGASFITGLGGQTSAGIPIQIEAAPGVGFGNHSIVPLTDALAVQALYSQLAPDLTQEQLNALIDASGNPMERTLESALDALRVILLGSDVTPTPWTTSSASRDALYTNLYNLMGDARYTALIGNATITPLTPLMGTEMKATDIAAAAQNDIAVRYALRALNPFALVGADYSAFNVDGALEFYDPGTGFGKLTQQYLDDRAAFLERKIRTKGVRDEFFFERQAHAVS
jgi:pimeloyl-ACP methyl ester carboxylesterase